MSRHHTQPQASQARGGASGHPMDLRIVQVEQHSLSGDPRPKGPSKINHKKSRNGCRRCKIRRVKCDEIHPTCANCQRHQQDCVYNDNGASLHVENPTPNRARSDPGASGSNPDVASAEPTDPDFSESRGRRLLELGLLHNYNTRTCQTLFVASDGTAADAWIRIAPSLALENEALLYTIFSFSACHMAEAEAHPRHREEAMDTHRRYLDLALRHHSDDLTKLNEKSFDAVCTTASILRCLAFVVLRDRPLDPYTPPLSWLQMTRGAVDVFRAAWKWIGNDENSVSFRLVKRMPIVFDDEAKFRASNRQGLLHLLRRDDEDVARERWHAEDQEAYETTLSYIGGIWLAMKGEAAETLSSDEIGRRLIIFPYLVKSRFIDLVQEGQPRALVVLGHYFALLHRFRSFWWIGDTGRREVQALSATTVLSGKWHDLMMGWPRTVMEEQPSLPR